MKPLKKTVSISLDENIVEEINQLAEYDDRSFSQYINLVLKRHLEKIKSENKGKLFLRQIQRNNQKKNCFSANIVLS